MNDQQPVLLRYSSTPGMQIVPVRETQRFGMKPCGLWVSVGTAWRDWCLEQEFNTDGVAYAARIYLKRDANILHLSSPQDLDHFTGKFVVQHGHPILDSFRSLIDWRQVALKWQGILIDPYIYARRLTQHTAWYYTWDIASGCIWDITAIRKTEPYPECMAVQEQEGPFTRMIELE